MERIGIEAEVYIADQEPAGSELLLPFQPGVRRAQAVGNRLPARAETCVTYEVLHAIRLVGVETRARAAPPAANIERSVKRNAISRERAIGRRRIEPRPKSGEAVGL